MTLVPVADPCRAAERAHGVDDPGHCSAAQRRPHPGQSSRFAVTGDHVGGHPGTATQLSPVTSHWPSSWATATATALAVAPGANDPWGTSSATNSAIRLDAGAHNARCGSRSEFQILKVSNARAQVASENSP